MDTLLPGLRLKCGRYINEVKSCMLVYMLVLINIVLLVTGQLLFKLGLNRIGAMTLQNLPAVLLSPLIWIGLGLYVIATLIWFAVLSRAQLNVVYPLQSLSYILLLVGSIVVFHEQVTPVRWLGVVVILFGVVLVSWQAKV